MNNNDLDTLTCTIDLIQPLSVTLKDYYEI